MDIACIVFISVTMNHLGLIKAVEDFMGLELKVLNCPKCISFWLTLMYQLITESDPLDALAISFLASYSAIWLELLEGIIDTLYLKIYETFYPTTEDDAATTSTK